MNNNIKYFETNDINLASALIANDIQLHNFSINGNIFTFIFEDQDSCIKMENLWLTDKLTVSAFKFSQALRQLKNIVFGRQNVTY